MAELGFHNKYPRKEVGEKPMLPTSAVESTQEVPLDNSNKIAEEYVKWTVEDGMPEMEDVDVQDGTESSVGRSSLGKKEGEGWRPAAQKCAAIKKLIAQNHSILKKKKVPETDLCLPLEELCEKYQKVREKFVPVNWGCQYCSFTSNQRDNTGTTEFPSMEDHYREKHDYARRMHPPRRHK